MSNLYVLNCKTTYIKSVLNVCFDRCHHVFVSNSYCSYPTLHNITLYAIIVICNNNSNDDSNNNISVVLRIKSLNK